jgi:uncharacterized protein YjbJ (UPF0337 family)
MSGKLQNAKGRVKQSVGKAIGNERLANSGRRDRAVGAAKERVSKLKRKLEDKVDEKLDEMDDRGRDRPNG